MRAHAIVLPTHHPFKPSLRALKQAPTGAGHTADHLGARGCGTRTVQSVVKGVFIHPFARFGPVVGAFVDIARAEFNPALIRDVLARLYRLPSIASARHD